MCAKSVGPSWRHGTQSDRSYFENSHPRPAHPHSALSTQTHGVGDARPRSLLARPLCSSRGVHRPLLVLARISFPLTGYVRAGDPTGLPIGGTAGDDDEDNDGSVPRPLEPQYAPASFGLNDDANRRSLSSANAASPVAPRRVLLPVDPRPNPSPFPRSPRVRLKSNVSWYAPGPGTLGSGRTGLVQSPPLTPAGAHVGAVTLELDPTTALGSVTRPASICRPTAPKANPSLSRGTCGPGLHAPRAAERSSWARPRVWRPRSARVVAAPMSTYAFGEFACVLSLCLAKLLYWTRSWPPSRGLCRRLGGAPPRLVLVGPVGLEREMAAASLRLGEIVVRPRPAKGFPPRLRGLAHRGPGEPVQALRLVPGEVLARVRCRVGSVTLAREEVLDGERSDGLQSVGAGKCDGGFGAKRADLLTPERAERAPVDGAHGVHAAKVLVRAQGGSPGLEQRGGHGSHAAADSQNERFARFRPSTSDSSAPLDARDPLDASAREVESLRSPCDSRPRRRTPPYPKSPAAPAGALRCDEAPRCSLMSLRGRVSGCQTAQHAPGVLTSANGASRDPDPRVDRARGTPITRALARRHRRDDAPPSVDVEPSPTGETRRKERAIVSRKHPGRGVAPPDRRRRSPVRQPVQQGRGGGRLQPSGLVPRALVHRVRPRPARGQADQAEGGAQGEGKDGQGCAGSGAAQGRVHGARGVG